MPRRIVKTAPYGALAQRFDASTTSYILRVGWSLRFCDSCHIPSVLIHRLAIIATILLAAAIVAGCGSDQTGQSTPRVTGHVDNARSQAEMPTPDHGDSEWFIEQAVDAGLHFVHFNGMSGEFYYPEIMAPGVGLLDYDNDGDLDVYLVQGQMLGEGKTLHQALFAPHDAVPLKGRLYRNDLPVHAQGARTLHFTDVTDQSGITARQYGMGVATGDFNNDGCIDLYLTNFGRNQLLQNGCNGTFTDVSTQSRVDDPGWSVSAAFVDYDRDGWLDLFVGHYLIYSVKTDKKCPTLTATPDYCPPQVYPAEPSRLYHNNRDGTFVDVTAAAGMANEFGPALGVTTADFNGDGWMDIYVANDGQPNQLWINQHDSTFKNTALLSGTALTADGKAEASMGVDAGDFDNDGDEDLVMTELIGQGSNLYVNDGSGMFEDQSARSGLGPSSLAYTGFGAAWFDFDNDSWFDLLAVNGTIQALEGRTKRPFAHDQRKQLFRNLRNRRFEDVTSRAGVAFELSEVGRGAAFGDIDNDGDTDVLVGNDAGRVRLLINTIGNRNHWLGLRLLGDDAPRDMLGARVELVLKTDMTLWRRVRTDGSYGSANDPRVLVGLGASTEAPTVRIRWPDGHLEEWTDVATGRYTTLRKGQGR